MKMLPIARAVALVLIVGTLGCQDRGYTATELGGHLEVSPSFFGIDEGLPPVQFSATVDGTPVAVTWTSSDPAVATVSNTGLVTPLNDGFAAITATMTATAEKKSASFTVNELFGTPLVSGTLVSAIAGVAGDTDKLYRIYVPEGSSNLDVTMSGGTGDFDIYVVRGPNIPSYDNWTCRPYETGNEEVCSIPSPGSGTWYIWLDVYESGTGVTLRATVTP